MVETPDLTQFEIVPSEFDLDTFFDSIPDDLIFDLDGDVFHDAVLSEPTEVVDPSAETPVSEASVGSGLSWVNELEQFLLEEEGGAELAGRDLAGEFFAGVFEEVGDEKVLEAESNNSGGSVGEEREEEDGDGVMEVLDGEANSSAETAGEVEEKERRSGDEEDTVDKKKARQIRNRDSAMKSRERKKMLAKDLETKNKFLESECRRLEHLLRCIAAENVALHQRLQTSRIAGVSRAGQESAVLDKEPLLLGSLFWLVNTVFLFLGLNLLALSSEVTEEKARRDLLGISQNREIGAKRLAKESSSPRSGPILMGRRCKGFRTRIKDTAISFDQLSFLSRLNSVALGGLMVRLYLFF